VAELVYDIDQIIGYLYSTSYASAEILGDGRAPSRRAAQTAARPQLGGRFDQEGGLHRDPRGAKPRVREVES
jgi:hypothetical protein